MSITFNADEIFEMAAEIERNGAKFYRSAAANTSDDNVKKVLLDLATVEEGHLVTFKQMRKELSGQEKSHSLYDPDDQCMAYLQAMADANGYEGKVSPTIELTGNESIREILEIAVNSEKESVVFYYGLKEMVPVNAGRDKVENIILEELSHITILTEHLKQLD